MPARVTAAIGYCVLYHPAYVCLRLSSGVSHVVLERAAEHTTHPQAHFINNRTMEVS